VSRVLPALSVQWVPMQRAMRIQCALIVQKVNILKKLALVAVELVVLVNMLPRPNLRGVLIAKLAPTLRRAPRDV
jgi:hypothetical protein